MLLKVIKKGYFFGIFLRFLEKNISNFTEKKN
ncbi:hypothetical protein cce_2928 [Crocosphaera subtropica ATCC 51142]|uniref:Uncharacterized protein n=1 Tax=Crocosphaera subtropica (strain ATCC 51142 / BH68) TaxID=43989 RepID=B1WV79_CROS5|nr:hypothetical protein cce_2928 [Crocosphaera subtropica ATCC 51142]